MIFSSLIITNMKSIVKHSMDYRIYCNIPNLCKRRNYNPIEIEDDILKFNTRCIGVGKFEWTTKDSKGKDILIMFICSSSSYVAKKEFTKLLDRFTADKIIVVFSSSKEIEYHKQVEFIDGSALLMRNFDDLFTKRGISIRVVGKDEWQHISNLYKIPISALPKIIKKAHEIVYSEAEVGDVVELIYPSFNSGLLDGAYRLVVDVNLA